MAHPHDRPHEHGHAHAAPASQEPPRPRGRRLTRNRQAVWEVFAAEPDRHLSADDVVERLRSRLPRVVPSTVYRTLDRLVADDVLTRTDLGSKRSDDELVREHAHHHVVCERCERR